LKGEELPHRLVSAPGHRCAQPGGQSLFNKALLSSLSLFSHPTVLLCIYLLVLLHIEKVKIFSPYSRETSYFVQHPDSSRDDSFKEGAIAMEGRIC